MASLEAYNKKSREHIVCSRQGKPQGFLSTPYSLLSTKILSTEKGVALVMVLILAVISLAIMAALVYMLVAGTQISGMQKRYKTALEASVGGSDIIYQVIASRIDNPVTLATNFNFLPSITFPTAQNCFNQKLIFGTSAWSNCAANQSTMSIDPLTAATYDMSFTVGTNPTYTVYAKIVDTVPGNSGGDIGLTKGGALESAGAIVKSVPFLYTIEVQAQNTANPNERAKLSILYEY